MPRGVPRNKEKKTEVSFNPEVNNDQTPADKILNLMSDFAKSLEGINSKISNLNEKVMILENKPVVKEEPSVAFSIGKPTEMSTNFLTQVPSNFLKVANEILGDKFQFECEALPDQPAFRFTVIVPSEYSSLKDEKDIRSKVISNSLGDNGVRDWCLLVKQNVIKYLGDNISVTKL